MPMPPETPAHKPQRRSPRVGLAGGNSGNSKTNSTRPATWEMTTPESVDDRRLARPPIKSADPYTNPEIKPSTMPSIDRSSHGSRLCVRLGGSWAVAPPHEQRRQQCECDVQHRRVVEAYCFDLHQEVAMRLRHRAEDPEQPLDDETADDHRQIEDAHHA